MAEIATAPKARKQGHRIEQPLVEYQVVVGKIAVVRGQRVMFAHDLAELYGVETKVLMQAVKRNAARFPADFNFFLTEQEIRNLKSQIVTSSWGGAQSHLQIFGYEFSNKFRHSRAGGNPSFAIH